MFKSSIDMKKIITISILIFSLFPASIKAQQLNSKGVKLPESKIVSGKIYALIIGISKYAMLPKLQYADKDAIAFYQYLKGIVPAKDSTNLFLLLNTDATRDAVTVILEEIGNQIKEGDKLIFYFSGHGGMEQLTQKANSLLLLSNCENPGFRHKSNYFLDINSLNESFEQSLSKKATLLFICDACHSGAISGGMEGQMNNMLGLQQAWNQEVKLLSCLPDQVSIEGVQWGGGRGLFSYYFLLGLEGLADKNKNNDVNIGELKNYLETNVKDASSESQIPSIIGDPRVVISNVTAQTIAAANKEKGNSKEEYSLAMKGSGGLIDLIKDSAGKSIYRSFKENIRLQKLINPNESCAYYYYSQFEKNNGNALVRNNMRIELISALQQPFDQMLDYVYQNAYDKMGIYEKVDIEEKLNLALKLADKNKVLLNQVRSKLLFYKACEITSDIMPNTSSYENTEKMNEGITLLKQALTIDSLSPNLYLKLGDYYLYTNKPSNAVNAYLQYQQLLPYDAQSYNKLGLGYFATRLYDLAIAAFKKAIKIDPNLYQAVDNLRIVNERKAKL